MAAGDRDAAFYAETYDASVPDWPGEIEFYRRLGAEAAARGEAVLELACGTGRVAIRLARDGVRVVGLDLSRAMLAVARGKTAGSIPMRWVEGDMRAFNIEEQFGLVLIPGHGFHNLLTADDQAACLACVREHLRPGGTLVVHLDHQDVAWLGSLMGEKKDVFEDSGQFRLFPHPETGRPVRTVRAWSYERSTQTAICRTAWEELDGDGRVVSRKESEPLRLHCLFRFEVEHLLARAGFEVTALYGDFSGNPLTDSSSEMVWVARRSASV